MTGFDACRLRESRETNYVYCLLRALDTIILRGHFHCDDHGKERYQHSGNTLAMLNNFVDPTTPQR